MLIAGQDVGDFAENRHWKLVAEDDGCTERMRVPGGALYRTIVARGSTLAVAMVFVPTQKRSRPHARDSRARRTRA